MITTDIGIFMNSNFANKISFADNKRENEKIIIFTDLDGTLLDAKTYSFEPAIPALKLLREKDIPLIICSSKTRKEIEYYREKLDNHHPFISENGGGIYIPKDSRFKVQELRFEIDEDDRYQIIRLGARYPDLRKAIIDLQKEGFAVRGFGDMKAEELVSLTNLTLQEAIMAKERDFDEPFIFYGSKDNKKRLLDSIASRGFNYTEGSFLHILGNSDKGKAVSIVIELYKQKYKRLTTIAIGDSPNDIPMLQKVDRPIIVQKPDGRHDHRIDMPNLIKAEGIGPDGWVQAIGSMMQNPI